MRSFHLFCLIIVTLLTACTSVKPSRIPTSERLESVRAQRAAPLKADMSERGMVYGAPVFIRIFKQEGLLEAWVQDEVSLKFERFKTYPICNFSGRLGPKLQEGDGQAPEGFYMVGADQLNPHSQYHLSFDLGFPNEFDAAHGRTGSLLMIHGGCKSIGCYAMTDGAIEEIYLMVEASIANGDEVPVHIFPFEMNELNIYANFDPLWITFWRNLEDGYDIFEDTRMLPKVEHEYVREAGQGRYKYVFESPSIVAQKMQKYTNLDELKKLVE